MEKPFTLLVLEAITALLQAITRIGPVYYTWSLAPDGDFPEGKVLRGRSDYGHADPLPMLAITEDPRNLDQMAGPAQSTVSEGDWNLIVQGFVEDDPVHPTDPAYFLLADVKAALIKARLDRRNIFGFGHKSPCVLDIKLGRGVVRPADELSSKAYFWLPVTLSLSEDNANAFT